MIEYVLHKQKCVFFGRDDSFETTHLKVNVNQL